MVALISRECLLWLLDDDVRENPYFALEERRPQADQQVIVLFKRPDGEPERQPYRCRLINTGDYEDAPEWVLPDGKMRKATETWGWRPCADKTAD